MIEAKEREQANEEHKDEIGQGETIENEKGAEDKNGSIEPELINAKIECTVDIFGRVLSSLEPDL